MNYFKTIFILANAQLKSIMRNWVYVFFMLLLPILFLLIFGMMYGSSNTSSWNVAVFNNSKTESGKQISEGILKTSIKTDDNKDGFFVKKDVDSFEDAEEMLTRGSIDAIIDFPQNFGEISESTHKPKGEVKVIYKTGSSSTGQIVSSVMSEFMSNIDTQMGREKANFVVKSEESNKQGLSNFDYVFAGLLSYVILIFGLMGLSNAIPEDKKTGALKRIHASPVTSSQYLIAYTLAFSLICVVAMALMIAVAYFIFDWQMRGSWFNFIVFSFFSLIMMFGTGLAVGGWARNEQQASGLSNIVMFPLMFLSGVFIPRFMMPDIFQKLTDFVPLTPVNDGIRLIITENYNLVQILPQIGIISIWLIALYLIAFKVFRWE